MEKEHFEILLENIDSKFNIVIESHQSLSQDIADTRTELINKIDFLDFKIDTVNERIDNLDSKLSERIDNLDSSLSERIDNVEITLSNRIDAVAIDLKAHRNDTEAHQIYRVKEG